MSTSSSPPGTTSATGASSGVPTTARTSGALPAPAARTVRWEIAIVLGLSLGKSAVYAVVQLLDRMSQGPLQDQTTVLNPVLNDRWVFDLTYQLLNIGFALVPVLLVMHLVWLRGRNPFRTFGLDLRRPLADLGWGALLFLAMGLGTLAVYAGGRALGLTTAIVGNAMDEAWYTVPVLVLSALRHALVEEVIVVAWLVDRLAYLQQLRSSGLAAERVPVLPAPRLTAAGAHLPIRVTTLVLTLAVLRACYHLYQGIGPGLGNAVMGVVFVLFYLRYRRVMPLVIAHLLLDVTGFVASPLLAQLGWLGT
ncbi:CPBP family intramembrane glutamic endopeptidase [Micrococcus luteus]